MPEQALNKVRAKGDVITKEGRQIALRDRQKTEAQTAVSEQTESRVNKRMHSGDTCNDLQSHEIAG